MRRPQRRDGRERMGVHGSRVEGGGMTSYGKNAVVTKLINTFLIERILGHQFPSHHVSSQPSDIVEAVVYTQ